MKKIYVVTAGEYSDYRIEAVFDDREKAEEFEAAYDSWGTGCRIEEYELNPPAPPAFREGYSTYRVTMDRDGNVLECFNWGGKRPSSDFMLTYDNNLAVEVTAKDEQHAAKIANERRVQFIAGNKWPGK